MGGGNPWDVLSHSTFSAACVGAWRACTSCCLRLHLSHPRQLSLPLQLHAARLGALMHFLHLAPSPVYVPLSSPPSHAPLPERKLSFNQSPGTWLRIRHGLPWMESAAAPTYRAQQGPVPPTRLLLQHLPAPSPQHCGATTPRRMQQRQRWAGSGSQ